MLNTVWLQNHVLSRYLVEWSISGFTPKLLWVLFISLYTNSIDSFPSFPRYLIANLFIKGSLAGLQTWTQFLPTSSNICGLSSDRIQMSSEFLGHLSTQSSQELWRRDSLNYLSPSLRGNCIDLFIHWGLKSLSQTVWPTYLHKAMLDSRAT